MSYKPDVQKFVSIDKLTLNTKISKSKVPLMYLTNNFLLMENTVKHKKNGMHNFPDIFFNYNFHVGFLLVKLISCLSSPNSVFKLPHKKIEDIIQ